MYISLIDLFGRKELCKSKTRKQNVVGVVRNGRGGKKEGDTEVKRYALQKNAGLQEELLPQLCHELTEKVGASLPLAGLSFPIKPLRGLVLLRYPRL